MLSPRRRSLLVAVLHINKKTPPASADLSPEAIAKAMFEAVHRHGTPLPTMREGGQDAISLGDPFLVSGSPDRHDAFVERDDWTSLVDDLQREVSKKDAMLRTRGDGKAAAPLAGSVLSNALARLREIFATTKVKIHDEAAKLELPEPVRDTMDMVSAATITCLLADVCRASVERESLACVRLCTSGSRAVILTSSSTLLT